MITENFEDQLIQMKIPEKSLRDAYRYGYGTIEEAKIGIYVPGIQGEIIQIEFEDKSL